MLTCEYCVKLEACSAKAIAKDYEKNPKYEGERFCPDFKKVLTNVDHIRAMSDEELCEFILEIRDGDCLNDRCYVNDPHKGCDDCTLEWLKQPYKENEE